MTQALMEPSGQDLSKELSVIEKQVLQAFNALLNKPVEERGPFKVPFLEQIESLPKK